MLYIILKFIFWVFFIVSSLTFPGIIRLKNRLDRETNEKVEFEVIATDNGSPPMSSTATVSITVTDANDNAPVFTQHQRIFYVGVSEHLYLTSIKHESCVSVCLFTFFSATKSPSFMTFWLEV